MAKRAAALVLLAALWAFWQQPAAASKLVALVVGNETSDGGADRANLTSKLSELKSSLFSYGDETYIIEGINLPGEQLAERIRIFEARLGEAEIAFFYFYGMGAHSLGGTSYLVPQGWDGRREEELVALGRLLERMRLNPKRRGLVFLDALKPTTVSGWQPALRPGLGSLGKEADDDRLQIALLEIPGSSQSGGFLTTALVRQLQGERIKLPQFASLVQEDVNFDTDTRHVPLVFGSLGGAPELRRLSKEELAAKQQKCLAGREQMARDEPVRLAGPTREASRTFWHWFCPELQPPASARPVPIEPRASRQARPDDREPAPARRSKERTYASPRGERAASGERGSPQRASSSYGSSGASGARAAASAVPTP